MARSFTQEWTSSDAGLLLLRTVAGSSLFLKHGLEKLAHSSFMVRTFPDPSHLGRALILSIASVSDALCSVLILMGFQTRFASAFAFLNLFTAWAFVHQSMFFGQGAEHGELLVLYLGAFASLTLSGAGRLSVDSIQKHVLRKDLRL